MKFRDEKKVGKKAIEAVVRRGPVRIAACKEREREWVNDGGNRQA